MAEMVGTKRFLLIFRMLIIFPLYYNVVYFIQSLKHYIKLYIRLDIILCFHWFLLLQHDKYIIIFLFQVHDQLMTEISLLQISLASEAWQLSKKVVVPEGWLQFHGWLLIQNLLVQL
jgi:hypothetical protein